MRKLLAVIAGLALVVGTAQAASAAPALSCSPGAAPQLRDGGRADWYTMAGYLTCNVDPKVAGVTSITRELGYDSAILRKYVSMGGAQQAAVQQTQAWSKSKYLYTRDTYTPRETVTFRGSFRHAAVAGCGRVDASTVRCVWKGPLYHIVDLARGCGKFSLGIMRPPAYDYPVQDVRVCYYETKNDNGNTNTAVSVVPWGGRASCTEEFHVQVYRSGGGNTVGTVNFGCQDKAPYYRTISGRFSYASVTYYDGGGSSWPKTVYKSDMTGTDSNPS